MLAHYLSYSDVMARILVFNEIIDAQWIKTAVCMLMTANGKVKTKSNVCLKTARRQFIAQENNLSQRRKLVATFGVGSVQGDRLVCMAYMAPDRTHSLHFPSANDRITFALIY